MTTDPRAHPAVADAPSQLARADRLVLALLLLLACAVRFITYGNPALGFDEQFYLLVGDRMLHGDLPYVDIFDRKPVGIFLIYAGIRLLGGDGFVQYKLVATLFVFAAAALIYLLARHRAGRTGATLAAALYILWLNFMEGEGGQTPVFYNPLVIGAAALWFGALRMPDRLGRHAAAAMLLLGIAIQIKYTVVVEGAFFGCAFLWLAWRQGLGWPRIALLAAWMIALALIPTLLALLYYAAIGQGEAFLFANFLSVFGQGRGGAQSQLGNLAKVAALFLPFAPIALLGRGAIRRAWVGPSAWFIGLWLAAAAFAILAYWRFNSPHYAIPLLPPLCLALAPALDHWRRTGLGIAALALVAGQIVQFELRALKGGEAEMRAVAAAAAPRGGCIFIYDGYPGLYLMTRSCLPSRWAFPGHLNAEDENNAQALGVAPVAETQAILARRPDAIVDTLPVFRFGNRDTRAVLYRALRRDYRPVLCVRTARDKLRVVYRRKGEPWPVQTGQCPAELRGDAALPDNSPS
jgi:4-amino-4-deoxy-L-arabinose transferase-like glycosyltransferase